MRTLFAATKGTRSFLTRGKQRYPISWSAPIGHTQPQNNLFPAMLNSAIMASTPAKTGGNMSCPSCRLNRMGLANAHSGLGWARAGQKTPRHETWQHRKQDEHGCQINYSYLLFYAYRPEQQPAACSRQHAEPILGNSRYSVKLIMRLPPPSSAPASAQAISRE